MQACVLSVSGMCSRSLAAEVDSATVVDAEAVSDAGVAYYQTNRRAGRGGYQGNKQKFDD